MENDHPEIEALDKSNEFELSTIDVDILKDVVETAEASVTVQEAANNETLPSTSCLSPDTSNSHEALPEEIIQRLVTPSKDVKKINAVLQGSGEPRKCALKLLPFFFAEHELRECNTDGTHGKPALDPVRLNSLKGLYLIQNCFL